MSACHLLDEKKKEGRTQQFFPRTLMQFARSALHVRLLVLPHARRSAFPLFSTTSIRNMSASSAPAPQVWKKTACLRVCFPASFFFFLSFLLSCFLLLLDLSLSHLIFSALFTVDDECSMCAFQGVSSWESGMISVLSGFFVCVFFFSVFDAAIPSGWIVSLSCFTLFAHMKKKEEGKSLLFTMNTCSRTLFCMHFQKKKRKQRRKQGRRNLWRKDSAYNQKENKKKHEQCARVLFVISTTFSLAATTTNKQQQ